jgi:phage virion morphogenesis protein
MTGAAWEVTFDDAAILGALDRLELGLGEDGPLLRQIGEYGVASTQRRFQSETAPDGIPWAALNPAYASLKGGGYNILTLSGTLQRSMNFRTGASVVRWGSPMIYAAVHQFGATIVPKNARALYFKLGLGGVREMVVQSVTVPARPYLGISAEDAEEIIALTTDFMARLITG